MYLNFYFVYYIYILCKFKIDFYKVMIAHHSVSIYDPNMEILWRNTKTHINELITG